MSSPPDTSAPAAAVPAVELVRSIVVAVREGQGVAVHRGANPEGLSDDEIADRLERHEHKARGAYSPATARAARLGVKAWRRWCSDRDLCSLPGHPDVLAAYVDDLAAAGRKIAGIRQAVWAVGLLHRFATLPDPGKDEGVRLALKRVAKTPGSGTRQRQAAPLGEDDERLILRQLGGRPRDLRDAALLLVMRDLLARRSEAVALRVEDVQFSADGSATALIARSKTDQAGEGKVMWLDPATVARLRLWLSASRITSGPIFCSLTKAGIPGDALDPGTVSRILKRLAVLANLDPAAVSGHSCRVGMAQDLSAAGADVTKLMEAGRWKSPAMPARYTERQAASRGAVAQFRQRRRGF